MGKIKLILILITLFLFSCKKDKNTYIPLVNVDIYLYTNNPEFNNLNAVGGWTSINGGSRGIIVYRSSNTEFKAYDKHCPYDPSNSCGVVEVDNSNITMVDACCGSKFSITDGGVIKGPAGQPLKQYNTSFDGSKLHIYN